MSDDERVAVAIEALTEALRNGAGKLPNVPVEQVPTLWQMRERKATELRGLFNDGSAKPTERAAMAVLGAALIPLYNLPTRIAVECATGEDQYSATEGDLHVDVDKLIDDLSGDLQFKAVLRYRIRDQLTAQGIELVPWSEEGK